jgi:hypothetical protein
MNLPVVATTLSKAERKELCQFSHDLKVPSGHSSNFKRLVSVKDMKMNFNLMKSHDCHVLMRTMCGSRTGGWSLPGVMSD